MKTDQCEFGLKSEDVERCKEEVTTRIGGVKLCREHGCRTPKEVTADVLPEASCSAGWGRLNAIAEGLELHGYELSRGIGKDGNGVEYQTLDIKRPDSPSWEGVWTEWGEESDIDEELYELIALVGLAFLKYHDFKKYFEPNAKAHIPHTGAV